MSSRIALFLMLLSSFAAGQTVPGSFQAQVESVDSSGVLILSDGRRVGLQGVTLPASPVRPADAPRRLSASISDRLASVQRIWIHPDAGVEPLDSVDLVAVVRLPGQRASLNEELLRAGLGVFACRSKEVADLEDLAAAAAQAQRDGSGWFAGSARRRFRELPYLNGAVLGLHHQEEGRDYHRQIDELAQAGFDHLSLLYSVFVQKVDSTRIDRTQKRTVRDARLIETIEYASSRGMSVMLLPILLILEADKDEWRGVLRPRDEEQFWQNYDRFLAHYLDIAERTGVEIFSVGSELGSLEDRTETWERIITNARGRFRGLLTYSANWDHAHIPEFFGSLDVVGMTAYFSLTDKVDPTVPELVREWQRVGRQIRVIARRHDRKILFTELGYPSQNGINRDPWNYSMNTQAIDLQEQVDCFEAFMRAAPSLEFLAGAYFYDYYDLGGEGDFSYSPRGKPAMEYWKRWAAYRR